MKRLYYRTLHQFYEFDARLFDVKEVCRDIFIIIAGIVEISIPNGLKETVIDVLGRGSVIGAHFMIKEEIWPLRATAKFTGTTKVLRLQFNQLMTQAM